MMFDPTSGDLQETEVNGAGNIVRINASLSGDVDGSASVYHMRLNHVCQVIYKKSY